MATGMGLSEDMQRAVPFWRNQHYSDSIGVVLISLRDQQKNQSQHRPRLKRRLTMI
jgi:hypothetical protein